MCACTTHIFETSVVPDEGARRLASESVIRDVREGTVLVVMGGEWGVIVDAVEVRSHTLALIFRHRCMHTNTTTNITRAVSAMIERTNATPGGVLTDDDVEGVPEDDAWGDGVVALDSITLCLHIWIM